MQFVRELLEGKPQEVAVRGTITHLLKLQSMAPTDPPVFLYQVIVGDYLYHDVGCSRETREPSVGDEILSYRPKPSDDGYPLFMILSTAPVKEVAEVEMSDPKALDELPPPPFAADEKDAERMSANVS